MGNESSSNAKTVDEKLVAIFDQSVKSGYEIKQLIEQKANVNVTSQVCR